LATNVAFWPVADLTRFQTLVRHAPVRALDNLEDWNAFAAMLYFDDRFLDRVRRSYALALKEGARARGRVWKVIDARRKEVHDALVADDLERLREIFGNPISTDLYYGTDGMCRSLWGDRNTDFLTLALNSPRATFGQYQAKMLTDALASLNGKSVIEVGPGVGHTAYYAYLSGATDYTTIDLPLGMVAQACFLGAALGQEKIWLDGEDVAQAEGRIKLFCSHRKLQRTFDVALNADSITEMSLSTALDYASWLNRHVRGFISINHEMNLFTMAEVAKIKFAVSHSTRAAWPLRKGYFEEVFWLAGSDGSNRGIFRLRTAGIYRRGRTILHNRFGLRYARLKDVVR
jgi:hypothetical protein